MNPDIPMPPPMGEEPARDYKGRYLLPDPATGHSAAWTRVSTLKSKSSDTYNLEKWKMRMTLAGLGKEFSDPNSSLLFKLQDLADDEGSLPDREWNKQMESIADTALELGGGRWAAQMGTALHAWTEWVDRGLGKTADVPDMFRPYVAAYRAALAEAGIQPVPDLIERIVLNLAYGVAGTYDRVYQLADGSLVVGDIKSGKHVRYGWQEIAQQLAAYQTAEFMYDPDTQSWQNPPEVREDFGLIVHVPITAPVPTVELIPVSLAKGRTYLTVSKEVETLQRDRDMGSFQLPTPVNRLTAAIASAGSQEELAALYEEHSGEWTDSHTMLGQRRLATINKQSKTGA